MLESSGRIGLLLSPGSIISCYCDHENYPGGNGIFLRDHYKDFDSIWNLIHPGDMSYLNATHGWEHEELNPPRPLYYRERGDRDAGHMFSLNLRRYLELSKETESDYSFLYDSKRNEWLCYSISENYGSKVPIVKGNESYGGTK